MSSVESVLCNLLAYAPITSGVSGRVTQHELLARACVRDYLLGRWQPHYSCGWCGAATLPSEAQCWACAALLPGVER